MKNNGILKNENNRQAFSDIDTFVLSIDCLLLIWMVILMSTINYYFNMFG